jgi:hypothetical protein
VHFTKPQKFNDPFDSRCSFEAIGKELGINRNALPKNHFQKMGDNIKNLSRIACFTEFKDSDLMWSHYADDHKGYCVEYRVSAFDEKIQRFLFPVFYGEEIYDASMMLAYCLKKHMSEAEKSNVDLSCSEMVNQANEECFLRTCLTHTLFKSNEWAYEKEWRISASTELLNGLFFSAGTDTIDALSAISAVYFGARCKDSKCFSENIADIEKWAKKEQKKLYKVKAREDAYKLQAERYGIG